MDRDKDIWYACQNGDIELARHLIENGIANVNDKNENGFTPVLVAAINGHEKMVIQLLAMGANPYQVGPDGLDYSQYLNNYRYIHSDQYKFDSTKDLAIANNCIAMSLLKENANTDKGDFNGTRIERNPVHL